MDNKLHDLAKNIIDLQKEAVKQTLAYWKPEAENIIITQSKDVDRIEHTLDALCEVAFDEEVLSVYKKLCRYYLTFNPVATYEHIMIYREMWDNQEDNDNEK